jgi:hypothetical protein
MKIRREEKRGRQKQKVGKTMTESDTTKKESTGMNKRKGGR